MNQDEEDQAERWTEDLRARVHAASQANRDRQKFIQISNMPKKMNARSLVSFIAQTAETIPYQVDMCLLKHPNGISEQGALVQFKSEEDAFKTMQIIKSSNYASSWKIKFISEPKFVEPTEEDIKLCNMHTRKMTNN